MSHAPIDARLMVHSLLAPSFAVRTSVLMGLLLAAVVGMVDPQPTPLAARKPPKPWPNTDSLLCLLTVALATGVQKEGKNRVFLIIPHKVPLQSSCQGLHDPLALGLAKVVSN